jgi:hypothetical protein
MWINIPETGSWFELYLFIFTPVKITIRLSEDVPTNEESAFVAQIGFCI